MQTVRMKLSDLHKTDKNIRRHSAKQIDEYIKSLNMFGQIRPLVVTDDGEILVGNGMYEAFSKMGMEDCDCYVISGLSKAQRKKLMLADNKVYELGFTDVGFLEDILGDLDGDFDIPGYDSSMLEMIMATPAEATKEAVAYGTFEPTTTKERHDETESWQETQVPQYAPPVKTHDGGIVAPQIPEEHVAQDPEENRRYMICPHCGEKIWL